MSPSVSKRYKILEGVLHLKKQGEGGWSEEHEFQKKIPFWGGRKDTWLHIDGSHLLSPFRILRARNANYELRTGFETHPRKRNRQPTYGVRHSHTNSEPEARWADGYHRHGRRAEGDVSFRNLKYTHRVVWSERDEIKLRRITFLQPDSRTPPKQR